MSLAIHPGKSQKNRPVLIDFFALSGTGKSTHSKALYDHLEAEGFNVKTLSFTVRRNGKNGSFGRLQGKPVSELFKAISMGLTFSKISSRTFNIREILILIKWSYRLLIYDSQIRNQGGEGLDYIILDPSLSSKLKKFYKYFDEDSFVEVISVLEKNNLVSDIVVIIDADINVVKKRRLGRGSPETIKGDSATFSVRKAFSEAERRDTAINFITVGYDCFSNLEGNIQKIAELCVQTRSQLQGT